MRTELSNALGVAFLLQAVASLLSGVLFNALMTPNIAIQSMLNLSRNQTRAQMSVVLDIVTAMGIVWLSLVLFRLLSNHCEIGARTAMAFYILEAAMLLMSRFSGYALIRVSSHYTINCNDSLEAVGRVLLDTREFIGNAALIPFGFGAAIFYTLLFASKTVPAWLALWGAATVVPVMIVCIVKTFGVNVPTILEILMVPYAPFEFVCGAYILLKGLMLKV